MRSLVLLLALLAIGAASAASTSTPGGLSREETPQFILLTHDDDIQGDTYERMLAATSGRSANGCPLTATMFVLTSGTDCELVVDLYNRGYEIADHTQTHTSLLDLGKGDIEDEIVGARSELAGCGIPESAVAGFRAPYLDTKPDVREVLEETGFLYDSTLIEHTRGSSISNGMGDRVWPWDMGEGIPINCGLYDDIQKCNDGESYPGLWQVPLWDMSALGSYTMDYGDDGDHDVLSILQQNFDESYSGNRAPLPLFIHTPWLKSHQGDLEQFLDYAAAQPNVYFVTIQQLLGWMWDPVPASQLTPAALGCGNAGGAPGSGSSGAAPPPPEDEDGEEAPPEEEGGDDEGAPPEDEEDWEEAPPEDEGGGDDERPPEEDQWEEAPPEEEEGEQEEPNRAEADRGDEWEE